VTVTAERSARTTGRAERIRLYLILGALSAIGPLSIDMYLPALPGLTRDLSAGASLVQLTLTAVLIGLATGQVLAGPVSDTWGRKRPMFAGIVAYTFASLACAVAPDVRLLIALRLVQGMAGAACIVIARAMVRDMYAGPAAARFFSLLMLVNGVAPVAAPVIGGQVLRITSWRGVFAVLTVLGAAMTVSLLGLRETLPREDRHPGGLRAALRTYRELCADRAYVGYALSAGLAFAAMFAYISGSPFVVQDIYGLSPQAFSLVFAVNAVGLVAFSQVSGYLSGRVAMTTLLRTGMAIGLAGGVLLMVAVFAGFGLPGVLPALFLVVAPIGLTMPNSVALGLSGRPANIAGSASALFGLTQFVIGGVMAPLVGVAGSHSAVPMALVIGVSEAAAVTVLLALARGHRTT
jgi:MFS transporter, DHA1 family, multidrug resistance protein